MKRKMIAILGSCVLAVTVAAGCGKKPAAETSAAAETTVQETQTKAEETKAAETTAAETPAAETTEAETTAAETTAEETSAGASEAWVEITEKEADELVLRLFKAPEGAEGAEWMKCEELGDPSANASPVVQLSFTLNDLVFHARAQQGAPEDADIAGLSAEWTYGPEDVTLANWGGGAMQGKVYRSENETGYIDLITWYDMEIGIKYALSTAAADLDGFDIQAVAEMMYAAEKEPYGHIPDVPEEAETGDGVYGAHLQASDRDLIGTQNEAGIYYDIVYQSLLDDQKLYIVGSMNYRNSREQDPMYVSEDLDHVFAVDENTVCQLRGGDAGAEAVSLEEFAEKLKDLSDTGLYLELEVKDGVVVTASISA